MILRTLAFLVAVLTALSAAPAYACSVVEGYVRPSNFELVQIADAIVIARAVGGRPDEDDVVGSVVFETETVLKGAPPRRLELDFAGLGRPGPSDLANLAGSHPEGHAGPCNRATFRRGGRYLLFLGRGEEGDWGQLGYPFSRVNEDYSGEDNAWMRSVRRYLALQQALPPMEQIAALRRIAETGRQADGISVSAAERADANDHLSSISPWKPTAWLLDVYGRLERGEAFTARPDAANRESGNLDEVAAFLLGEGLPAGPDGPERLRLLVLGALAEGDHPEALPLIERLSAAPGTRGRVRGLVLRYLANNGQISPRL